MRRGRPPVAALALLWAVMSSAGPAAAETGGPGDPESAPLVGIIIDDLGDRLDHGLRAVNIQAALTYSFLPHAPYTPRLARLAHGLGKVVMAHLPMQSTGHHRLGQGGLRVTMSRGQFLHTVRSDIRAVPHASGVNNHMGSLLTQYRSRMGWLMDELGGSRGMFFIDSHTTPLTVAREVAAQKGVPALKRDVFLDAVPEPSAIQREFDRLLALARARGAAVAIAHPYPQTLSFLERRLPRLAAEGIRLVPVSALLRRGGPGIDPLEIEAAGDLVAVRQAGPDNRRRRGRPGHATEN